MGAVIRPVNRERLASRVGLVCVLDLQDPDRLVADKESDPIGSRHLVRAENDRDREGRPAREAALSDDRLVVLTTEETVERRKRAGAEHEDVRQLALTYLQLGQPPSLCSQLGQLIIRRQSIERPALQIPEPLQLVE